MKHDFHVLLIEDNVNDEELLSRALVKSNGFILTMERIETKKELIKAMDTDNWDLIICDVNLPTLDFQEAIKVIEMFDYGVPFIIVTGSISAAEIIDLLGYDTHYGYISKNELWLIGPYIKNIRQIEEEQYQQMAVLVRALEYRDHTTKEHSDRVVAMTVAIAEEMDINHRNISYIKRGALLHDIGKVGIPDNVLLKKGPLTPDEMDIMKMHPQLSYDMLKEVPSMKRVTEIPYYHHERWDGSGYPHGLKGNNIPLAARIFSVVDVYDAMTNNRIYRDALPEEDVIEYIKTESGKYFDPNVIEAFLKVIKKD